MASFLDYDRQFYNKQIISILKNIVEAYPQLRWHQILQDCGIEEIQDLFYEESSKTYSKLRDSKIVKELNIF